MSKKDYYLKKAQEEERRKKDAGRNEYRPWMMNSERMPFGCWIWVLVLVAPIIYGIFKLFNVLH